MMKKLAILLLGIALTLSFCAKKEPSVVLEKDSPAYNLALAVSEKISYYNPEQNNPLVKTKYFDITTGDVFNILQTNFGNRAQQLKSFQPERLKSIVDQNARQMSEVKLQLREAKLMGLQVTDQEVDSVIQTRYMRDDKDRFMSWLKNNNIDYQTVRNDTRDGLMLQKYNDKIFEKSAEVSEEEIMDNYKQDKYATVRHILLRTQGLSDSLKVEKYKQMEELLKRARAGEDFAELANQYSEDPGSNKNGGIYESFTRGKMVKPFEDASFNTPIGEISDIVETSYGYHIIKVIDRKPEEKPFDEVKDSIKAKLQREKQNKAYTDNLEKLKKKANFKIVEY